MSMKELIIGRLENLTLLSQDRATVELFNIEYKKLLGELLRALTAMKALAAIQAAYLEAQAAQETVQ